MFVFQEQSDWSGLGGFAMGGTVEVEIRQLRADNCKTSSWRVVWGAH